MSRGDEDFLRRWSRRKRQAAAEPPAKADKKPGKNPLEAKPGELPSLDSLTFDSDFTAFLAANVEESVKRAALKKLLHDPRFNVMDGLDTYIDDYTKNDPISEEMLKTLKHARSTLFGPTQESEGQSMEAAEAPQAPEAEQAAKAPEEQGKPQDDGNPRQDA